MDDHVTLSFPKMLDEIIEGLEKDQKELPSKYFYDQRGSQLFEEITELEEYYPTRTEMRIMQDNMPYIIRTVGSDIILAELGSGSSKKTRLLLDHFPSITSYIPIEISEQYLAKVVQKLNQEYPDLQIEPLCTDYSMPFQLPAIAQPYSKIVFFYPGSTIGNFQPSQAKAFLNNLSTQLDPGDGMLVGVDLKKNISVLETAYNDRQGVTASFNKNILRHINRKLDANFNLNNFRHEAFYNRDEGRIEMHLVSRTDQTVTIEKEVFHFKQGESIHTENSYKYSLADFETLVSEWFSVEKVWTDSDHYFSLQYLQKI
ncbi:L-histidine N(alpha)-methyltransferase [Fodinibius sediminis]|uniref:Dimethylhistidine N-methyltransferase n=1 Tax=Fodinibius sediminis TaxID=1214077 RepID=A0A521CN60_9BACT|nr:L-histidine N(alpha)-methyltransferase [Fodinibius sediminis]SMO60110.1 dimethylhistidine N-methyltransferase [Fodinibius sediminis]